MKRFTCLLLCLALCLPLAAFAADTINLTTMTDQELIDLSTAIVKEQQSRAQSDGGYIASQDFGNLFFGLVSSEIVEDAKYGKCVVLTIDYSHKQARAMNSGNVLMLRAYQDGVQLESAYLFSDAECQVATMVQPDTTLQIKKCFVLVSGSPVEIEASDAMDYTFKGDVLKISVSAE